MSHFDSPAVSLRFYFLSALGVSIFHFASIKASPGAKIADRARTNIPSQILWDFLEIKTAIRGSKSRKGDSFNRK